MCHQIIDYFISVCDTKQHKEVMEMKCTSDSDRKGQQKCPELYLLWRINVLVFPDLCCYFRLTVPCREFVCRDQSGWNRPMWDDKPVPDDFEVVESNQAPKINFSVIRIFWWFRKNNYINMLLEMNIIYFESQKTFRFEMLQKKLMYKNDRTNCFKSRIIYPREHEEY